MTFNNVSEAFNFYRDFSVEAMEKRAAEIKAILEKDSTADVSSLNVEIDGLNQAKQNAVEKRSQQKPATAMNPIATASFETRGSYEATEGNVLASAEYRNAFYKTLMGQKLNNVEKAAFDRAMVEQRSDAFSSTTDTAAVIPTQTLNEIVKKARTMGGLMSVCRGFNIPSKISIPVGTPATKASWNTEGTAVDSVKPSIATVSFGAYEIIKVFSISAAVKRMSVDAFESYLTDELTACVMECLADGVVNGTGSSQGTGVLPGVSWATTGTGKNHIQFSHDNGLGYADVVSTVALLKRGYANGACWAMNNATLYSLFYGMVDTNNRPIFIADPKAENIGKILGFNVVVDDNLADEVILFGNFNYMGYNLPEGIAIEASTQSSFKSGRIDYRAMAIADCKPIVTEAFVKLTRAAS